MTSSPRYPQSNGKVENAVKTVKRLFTKCQEDKQSEYQALLDWRNTPTEALGSSPAQRFLGRRCRTLLPIAETLLKPAYDTSDDARALKGKRAKQAHYFNQQARDFPPLAVGETVRLRLPGRNAGHKAHVLGAKVLGATQSELAELNTAGTDAI